MNLLHFPDFYKIGIIISILIGLIFLSYFGIRFAGETKKRSEALNKLQEIVQKEYELESLGGEPSCYDSFIRNSFSNYCCCSKRIKKGDRR